MIDKKNNNLTFIPTYNEKNNIVKLVDIILSLKDFDTDIFIIDDNSPDNTYGYVKNYYSNNKKVYIINRGRKKGLGSAHKEGIEYAKKNNYKILITLDSDFTHDPNDFYKFLKFAKTYDIVIGNRFVLKESLSDWNIYRKAATNGGHLLTKYF